MFRWPRLIVLLLLTLSAVAPARACHAAPPPMAAMAHHDAPASSPRHPDAALVAPCLGCAVSPAMLAAATLLWPMPFAPLQPAASAALTGSGPAPADRPPRATA